MTVFAAVLLITALYTAKKPEKVNFSGYYFDTVVTVKAETVDKAMSDKLRQRMQEISDALSAYDENAQVYGLNHGEQYAPEKYPHIKNVLEGYAGFEKDFGRGVTPFCGSLTSLWQVNSDTPRVPSETEITAALEKVKNASDYNGVIPENALIDLGSGGKGYACDMAYDIIKSSGKTEEIIFSCSSSTLLYSGKERVFKTQITDPTEKNDLVISTENCFISTSGGYERFFECEGERYSHIMDIETGCPVKTDIASATVILPCEAGNGITSDLLSTLIFIGGSEKAEGYAEKCALLYPGCGIVIITETGVVTAYGEVNFIK